MSTQGEHNMSTQGEHNMITPTKEIAVFHDSRLANPLTSNDTIFERHMDD